MHSFRPPLNHRHLTRAKKGSLSRLWAENAGLISFPWINGNIFCEYKETHEEQHWKMQPKFLEQKFCH